jgi:hypothetical protein
MKIPDIPQEMNWADYWDALCDEYFELRQSADGRPAALSVAPPRRTLRDSVRHDEQEAA